MMENRGGVRPALVAAFLFGSGFCALVYQTVWLRELRNVFGASTAATAAVIGIFMAGLGAGGLRLGRTADRSRNPLNLYAMLELGVTVAALGTLVLLPVVERIYWSTGGTVTLGMSGATVLRLLLAVLLLGPATFFMGGTLPAAARSIIGRDDVRRRSIAMLYGVNTIGAVTGAVVSTFFALELFGNMRTLLLAVLINAIVVVAARAHARMADGSETLNEPIGEDRTGEEGDAPGVALILSAAVVTGFVFMLMEMVWYRVLAPILGGSTFTFGLILAMALAGIGLGGLAYSFSESRGPATARLFSLTCALEALALSIPFALGDRIAVFAVVLQPMEVYGFIGRIISWALLSAIVVLPASIVAGFQFPLLIALAGRARENAGRDVGRIYAFNTAGAILGSLCGGFGLMPILSAEGCWSLSVWTMAMLAIVFSATGLRRGERAWEGAVLSVLTILLLVGSIGPTAVWRHSPIGVGRVKATFETSAELKDWMRETKRAVVWESEGVESAVAVVDQTGYAFVINGKADGHSIGDAGTQIMGGLIGAIQHEKPTKSLVIGLGTGSTAGWLASVPGMERVDVAELEPDIVEVAKYCAPVNENVLEKKNVKLFIGDAREILLASDETYDLIFSEPSNPYRAGIASLFTKEFYEASSRRLADGGVFMQWVQGYEVTPRTLETIFLTLHDVFPYIQIWETLAKDNVLVASAKPIPLKIDLIRERVGQEPYRRAAAGAWKAGTLEEFLAHYVSDQRLIELAIDPAQVEINTDDRNVVEFGFARSVGLEAATATGALRDLARRLSVDGLPDSSVDVEAVRRFTVTSPLTAAAEVDRLNALEFAVEAYRRRDFAAAVQLWAATGLTPETHSETLLVAHSLAQLGDERCEEYATSLERYAPVEAGLVRGICAAKTPGQEQTAARILAEAFARLSDEPWVDPDLVGASLVHAESIAPRVGSPEREAMADAVSERFRLSMVEDFRKLVALRLSAVAEQGRCGPRTLRSLHALEPYAPWRSEILRTRADCYRASGDPLAETARRESVEFQLQSAEPFGATQQPPR